MTQNLELNVINNKRRRRTFIIVIRNGKIVWKHGLHCWYFHLNLKYLGWPYREYIKTAKNVCFLRNHWVKMTLRLFSHFLLSWLWCQNLWGRSEDRYRSKRLSQMLLVCYSLLNNQNISINNSEKTSVTYLLGHHRCS